MRVLYLTVYESFTFDGVFVVYIQNLHFMSFLSKPDTNYSSLIPLY